MFMTSPEVGNGNYIRGSTSIVELLTVEEEIIILLSFFPKRTRCFHGMRIYAFDIQVGLTGIKHGNF